MGRDLAVFPPMHAEKVGDSKGAELAQIELILDCEEYAKTGTTGRRELRGETNLNTPREASKQQKSRWPFSASQLLRYLTLS